MPYIQCNIQSGLSFEKKQELAIAITKDVHEALGSPAKYIHVGIAEFPPGQFVESGELNLQYSSSSSNFDNCGAKP